jgi:hypothetical protein
VNTRTLCSLALTLVFAGCAHKDRVHTVRVSVADQKLAVYKYGTQIATYDVSTSKFGLGDRPRSCCTPLGRLEIAKKVGAGAPIGMKFKDRRPTGEIVQINAPGRDPIVTRIFGSKASRRKTGWRTTGRSTFTEPPRSGESGTPASYGCIRMRSRDVVELFNTVGVGAEVDIVPGPLHELDLAQHAQVLGTR